MTANAIKRKVKANVYWLITKFRQLSECFPNDSGVKWVKKYQPKNENLTGSVNPSIYHIALIGHAETHADVKEVLASYQTSLKNGLIGLNFSNLCLSCFTPPVCLGLKKKNNFRVEQFNTSCKKLAIVATLLYVRRRRLWITYSSNRNICTITKRLLENLK